MKISLVSSLLLITFCCSSTLSFTLPSTKHINNVQLNGVSQKDDQITTEEVFSSSRRHVMQKFITATTTTAALVLGGEVNDAQALVSLPFIVSLFFFLQIHLAALKKND